MGVEPEEQTLPNKAADTVSWQELVPKHRLETMDVVLAASQVPRAKFGQEPVGVPYEAK